MRSDAWPPKRQLRRAGELAGLLGTLAISAYLRFANLATNPGWYSDEGTIAEIARNMAAGRTQYLALTDSTLLVARFPVVPFLVSRLIPLGGEILETQRILTAALGVTSTLLVFWLVRLSGHERAVPMALLCALLYSIYPPGVFYSRVGFSYNLLTPLSLIVVGGLWLYFDRGKRQGLVASALAIGVGSVTDLMMVSLAVPAFVILALRRPRELLWWTPVALLPAAVYVVSLFAKDAQMLLFDASYLLQLLRAVPWWAQLPLIALNFGTLALEDPWWIPAIVGLLLLRGNRWRRLLLVSFFLPFVLLGRGAGLAGVRQYLLIPLFPYLAIGLGTLIWLGTPRLLRAGRRGTRHLLSAIPWLPEKGNWIWFRTRLVALASAGLVFLIVMTPLLISTLQLFRQVEGGFRPANDWAYLPVADARAAVEFVNRRARPSELVIGSPALAWALDARRVDFQQVLAYGGAAAVDYPGNVPRDRFAFEADLERARYAIVDPIWREWGAVHLPEAAALLVAVEGWPIVMKSGSIEVRENGLQKPGG